MRQEIAGFIFYGAFFGLCSPGCHDIAVQPNIVFSLPLGKKKTTWNSTCLRRHGTPHPQPPPTPILDAPRVVPLLEKNAPRILPFGNYWKPCVNGQKNFLK